MKTDAFYCTRLGEVKGVLTLRDKYMQFDPVQCSENDFIVRISKNSCFFNEMKLERWNK
jgi:hypothetical protein